MPKVSRRWKPELTDYLNARLFEVKPEGKGKLTPGTEVTFRKERGRFRFCWAREVDAGLEITVYGGTKHYQSYRTFMASRIKHVHRIDKLRKK